MTVSVKAPTSTTGSIQLNASDVLTIESDRSVDIDSNTLHVDATNNRVGVGTSSPTHRLAVEGTADNVDSQLKVTVTNVASGGIGLNSSGMQFGCDLAGGGFIFRTQTTGGDSFTNTGTERMRIDSSGRVTMPYQPYFYASRSTGLTVDPSNQTQAIVFDSTSKNVGNHYSTSTGLFTAPVSGIYAFSMSVLVSISFSQLWSIVNGARSQTFWNGTGTTGTNAGAFTKYLNANDTIGIHAYDSATSANIASNFYHTYFEGGLIG